MIHLNSISDLAGCSSSGPAMVATYYPGQLAWANPGNLGGGVFYRASQMPKSKHNGGDIISDTVPRWDGERSTLASFHLGYGDTDPTGVGCWVKSDKSQGCGMFGATGNRIDPDTVPINGYIRSINMKGTNWETASAGQTLYFPDGSYPVTQLDPILVSGVRFKGQSEDGSIFICSGLGAIISYGNAVSDGIVGGGVRDVKFEYPIAPPPGFACCVYAENANRLKFKDIMIVNITMFFHGGNDQCTRNVAGMSFSGISGYARNAGQNVFQFNLGAGLHMSKCAIYTTVMHPESNRTSVMATVPGTRVMSFGKAAWDTVQISHCLFERFYDGMIVNTSGAVVQNVTLVDVIFDYCRSTAVTLAPYGSTGGIFNFKFIGCWFSSWEDSAFAAIGTGTADGVEISDCTVAVSGGHGIQVGTTYAKNFNIHDNIINGCGRIVPNSGAIAIFCGDTHQVNHNQGGDDSSAYGFPWRVDVGLIYVGGDAAALRNSNPRMNGRLHDVAC